VSSPRYGVRWFTARRSVGDPNGEPVSESAPEPDLTGIPVQNEAYMRRLHRVFAAISNRDTDTPKMREMRAFWISRSARYCKNNDSDKESWSVRNILSSVTARKVPSGMAKRYFVFASCVSLGFESVRSMDPSDGMFHDLIVHMTSHQEALARPVGFLATALFLMASFRLNRATARWWQARTLWGDLHADVRSFVSPPPSEPTVPFRRPPAVCLGLHRAGYAPTVRDLLVG
jgi:hypothetical protein